MNKHYAPLKIGKNKHVIVTDTPVSFNKQDPDEGERLSYGGYLVAESVPEDLAQQLVEAYNMYYDARGKVSSATVEKAVWDGLEDSLLKVIPNYIMEEVVKVLRRYRNRHPEFILVSHDPEEELPSIDEQIKWLDKMYELSVTQYPKRHPDKPDSPYEKMLTSIKENLLAVQWRRANKPWKELDVEKVLSDLIVMFSETHSQHPSIQNAETALGMLHAFKEKRHTPHDAGKRWEPNMNDLKLPKIHFDSPDFHAGMNYRKEDDDEKIKDLIAFTEDKIGAKIQWNDQHRVWQQVLPEISESKKAWSDFPKEMEKKLDLGKQVSDYIEKEYQSKRTEILNKLSWANGLGGNASIAIVVAIEEMLKLYGISK